MIRRWRAALPAALLVHGCNALCALFMSLPLSISVPDSNANERVTVQALVLALRLLENVSQAPARYVGLPAAVTFVCAPFLLLVWLRATIVNNVTSVRDPLPRHAQFARTRYLAALGLWLAWLAYGALLLLMAAGAALGAQQLLAASHDERSQACAALVACLPFALALLHASTWFDLAHLTLAHDSATTRAALQRGLRHTRPATVLLRGVFGLAALALTVLGAWGPRALFGLSLQGSLATWLVTQLVALAVSLLRGAWLALLVERMAHTLDSEHGANRLATQPPT